jgi:YggT family protein
MMSAHWTNQRRMVGFLQDTSHVQAALQDIFGLVLSLVANILGGAMLLRFWTQVARVRPPAEISPFLYKSTDWLVLPIRRLVKARGKFDWASLIGAFIIAFVAAIAGVVLLAGLIGGNLPHITSLFGGISVPVTAMLYLVKWVYYGLLGLLILGAVFSWINPAAPLAPYVNALTEPLLTPLRRVIPPIANIDFSPLIAMLILQAVYSLVIRLIVRLML